MNAIFGSLTTEGLEEAEDRLGGFQALPTDAYEATITAMYAGQSQGGAHNVTVVADVNGREYRETIYVTNKKGENFFLNKNDKTKKVPLPGFTTIDHICLVATGAPLSEQATEEKVVKVWDPEARKEMPTSVPMLTDCLGKNVGLLILNILENKSQKNQSTGAYEDTAEERNTNEIDKVYDIDSRKTVVEAVNEVEEPSFVDAWIEKNKDQVRDKRSIKDGQAPAGKTGTGRPGAAPKAGANGGSGSKSLFGKK